MPTEKKQVKVEVIQGVEGKSVYINDYRVVGNKPWGGGSSIFRNYTDIADIIHAIGRDVLKEALTPKFKIGDKVKIVDITSSYNNEVHTVLSNEDEKDEIYRLSDVDKKFYPEYLETPTDQEISNEKD